MSKQKKIIIILLVLIIIIGIGSRVLHTSYQVFDKYLGDSLYAAMFYLLLRLFWEKGNPLSTFGTTMLVMILIEVFQLTGIPSQFQSSGSSILKYISILLGTEFSWLDIMAYFVGLVAVSAFDHKYIRPIQRDVMRANQKSS
jgi:hypothetical protein